MILSTMAFVLTTALVASLAALLADAGLRRMGAPSRFVWLAAMAASPALLALDALGWLGDSGAAAPTVLPVIELPPLLVGGADPVVFPGLTPLAVVVWVASGVGVLALLVATQRRLLRERAGWESTQVLGKDVFVSVDRGPAVAGMWNPWIVLPRWVLALPESELRMVLLHEEEHLRARDSLLLHGALGLVVASAWNPLTWWQLRRLRSAMEMDCDRRVLLQAPDRSTYGSSLLSVAARASGSSLGLAAFTERSLSLKRRILAMTAKTSRWTALGGGVMIVLGAVVGLQACGVDGPLAPELAPAPEVAESRIPEALTVEIPGPEVDGEAPAMDAPDMPFGEAAEADAAPPVDEPDMPFGEAAEAPAPPSVEAGPTFTPFTVAPSITNREEVIAAMEAEYPPLLKDAAVGGTIRVYFLIGDDGLVKDVRVDRSSGHAALDEAALRVADVYRFTPALNRDEKVPVWVSFPITFAVR